MIKLELEDIKSVAEMQLDWKKLDNCTIMISGGTGFIGSFLCDVFKYRNEHFSSNIKVLSLSRRGGTDDDTVRYLKADITKEINFDDNVDYVIHLASNTHPRQYAEDPVGTITTNIIGCNNLLSFAKEHSAKRFLLASSVEIYGQGTEVPMDEGYCGYIDCNQARAGYNEAKRTCEALCQSYIQQYGTDSVIVRFARVFGPDKKKDTKAISQFMDKALAGEDIVLKSKGNQRYSFVYVSDAASALLKVLLDGKTGEAYNVAAEDEGMTLGEYAEYIASLTGKEVIFDIEDNASVSKATYALLDINKIKELGWKPSFSVKDGLRRTYIIKGKRKVYYG